MIDREHGSPLAKMVITKMNRHRRALAIGLALAGLTTAAINMGWTWSRLTSTEYPFPTRMWPLPALYLVEAVVLPAIVLWAVIVAHHRGECFGAWLAVGALATVALLGAMSIGLNMALALIFLVPASVLADDRRSTESQKVAAFVLGGFFQGGVMFAIIQYVLRRPVSGLPGG